MAKKEQPTLDFDKDIAKFTERQKEVCAIIDGKLGKYILYGGCLGGGKSYLLRWIAIRMLMGWFFDHKLSWVQVMLACEDYPSLKDRQITKIDREFPSWLGQSYSDHKTYGKCFILKPEYGNGVICLRNLDDPSKYQSAEFAAILVDELTKNPYDTFNDLRMRLRWSGLKDDETFFIGGTNPGGIGHSYCKAFWIDKIYPKEYKSPVDYTGKFAFVKSKAEDNPYLDETYWQMLNTLPAHIRPAFKDGSWDTFVGQALQEWNRLHHVIEPIPVPKSAPIFMTFDWGFGAPFSVGWWWVDSDGRFYRFNEWYGWNGTPNQGVRLADSEIAQGIIKKERAMGFNVERDGLVNPQITRLCDPTCFNKKPDYKGGGQGMSTAEEFRRQGIVLRPGDPSRTLKLRQFHQRLLVPEVEEGKYGTPMMQIYNNCIHFIRTIPTLVVNPNNIEDIDCFVAGTKIATPNGDVVVENIKVGDLVKTPIGNRKVIKAGISGNSEKVIEVFLSNGETLKGTANHRVFVKGKGLVELQKLNKYDELETEGAGIGLWRLKRLCITVSHIAEVMEEIITDQAERISNSATWNYIDRFIKTITEPFQKDMQFTTSTTTVITMPLKTLLQCQCSNTQFITENYLTKNQQYTIGRIQKTGKKYYETMREKCLRILQKENFRAEIVERLLRQNTLQKNFATTVKRVGEKLKKYVPSVVMNILEGTAAVMGRKPVHITAVGNYEEKIVYKLTVAESHLYYANGVLVTNTDGEDHCFDEAALLAMARPMSMSGNNKWKEELNKEQKHRPKNLSEVAHMELQNIFNNINEDITYRELY